MKITKNFWISFSWTLITTLYCFGFLLILLYWGYKENWFGDDINNFIRIKIGPLQVIVDWFRNLCLIIIGINVGNILPIKLITFEKDEKNN